MKLLILVLILLFTSIWAICQNISGEWKGVGQQPGAPIENSSVVLYLTQADKSVSGTLKSNYYDYNEYCIYSVTGFLNENKLILNCGNPTGQDNNLSIWCCPNVEGELTLSINNEELKFEGTLTSPSCQPNAIKLSKTNPSFKKNINIKCNEYVSPIFIPKENILEINNAAKLAGYPFAEFPYASISNGCGANDDWKSKYVPDGFFGLADFTYACNCHDLCYLTSDNKNICDTKFYNTLVDICNSAEHVNKKGCNKIAELYLESVREFGEEPYRKSRIIQKKYENWLSGYTKKLKVQSVVENTQYGTVKTKQGSPLNLRSKPSEKATIITQIPNGSEVQILAYDNEVTLVAGEKGKWYNVLYDDNIGWVWGNYLKLNPVDIEPATKIEIKFVSDKKEGRANTKEGSPLNLRTEPKIRADNIIAKIPKGSKLIIIGYDDRSVVINGEKGKWYEVQFNNAVGWAWGNYIISASLDSIIESYHDLPGKVADIPIKYQKTVAVQSKEVTIYPFDNEMEDGDIVSINVNGVWVRDHFILKNMKANPSREDLIKCSLNPGNYNYFVSRAWNVGSKPPNTLTIKIDDGVSVQEILINSDVGLSGGIRIVCNK